MLISEFSAETGISCSAIRYYEDKGLIRVNRDFGNRRIYSENDVEWVRFIERLKNTGMPLREIKRYSDLRYEGDSTVEERLRILRKHSVYVSEQRHKWEEYEENLKNKIAIYERILSGR